jgi:predicted HicB family RNase H-like nuclease
MFDVKKPEYVNKTFRMPVSLITKLQEVAQAKDVSLNYLVIRCCEYALEDLKKE